MIESKSIINSTPRENDYWDVIINDTPIPVHFYYIDRDVLINSPVTLPVSQLNMAPFTQSGQVLSMIYTPFLNKDHLNLFEIPYDQEHYGTVKPNASSITDYQQGVNVYKIGQQINTVFNLGKIEKYPSFHRSSLKSYYNESKLYQYPYHYITINDAINEPLKIIPHLAPDNIQVKASQPLTVTGGYTIYVDGYKGDNTGVTEGMFSNAGLDLPTSSSQYSNFMATSKANFLANNEISRRNQNVASEVATIGFKNSIVNSVSSLPNLGNAIGTAVSGYNDYMIKGMQLKNERDNFITSAQAQIQDLQRSPRSVSMSSSDILMSLQRNKRHITAYRYHIQEYYLNKLADYFTLYGYKQNKFMTPDIKSRKYFNYVKTLDANVIGNKVSKEELNQIKEIYNSGITFWHYFNVNRDLDGMYDYSKDNVEV